MLFSLFLTLSLLATRFLGLDWGGGHFFHPDENNMAWGIGRISWPGLNPAFFAYGQFPLYLVFLVFNLIKRVLGAISWQKVPFPTAVYGLRTVSAFFSVLAVVFGYLLAKEVFKEKKWQKVYALLLIFIPGLIQTAHFGTTESLLVFVALALSYFSIVLLNKPNFRNLFWAGVISAIGLASKISAALFLLAPVLSILLSQDKFSFRSKRALPKKQLQVGYLDRLLLSFLTRVRKLFIYSSVTALFTLVLSPHLILSFENSLSTLRYESEVASGASAVFYTRQFINTTPFLFQLTKVFPWVLGTPLFFLIVVSLFLLVIDFFKKRFLLKKPVIILLAAFLPWFLFNSILFTKWTRFMAPVLPLLLLLPVWLFKKAEDIFKKEYFLPTSLVFLFFSILPGLIFLNIYLMPDIRFQASSWMTDNIPKDSLIFSETGNVVDMPVWDKKSSLFSQADLNVSNFDFYSYEEKEGGQDELEDLLKRADYVLVPSRRIFANYSRLSDQFPKTADFHRKLFSGELDFSPLVSFEPVGPFGQLLLGTDLLAEETWTVFDHPTIRLFVRDVKNLKPDF